MRRLRPSHWAIAAIALLVTSTLGFSAYGSFGDSDDPGAPLSEHARSERTEANGPRIAPHGLDVDAPPELTHDPPFPLGGGTIPTKSEALDFDARFSRFIAIGTDGLDQLADQGHLEGTGTQEDPYVLE